MPIVYGKHRPFKAALKILKNRGFWVSIAIVLVLCGSVATGLWAHGKWTNRQSWKLAGLAEQQVREGRTEEALMGLETALRLRPDNPSALRQLARLRTSLGQRQEALAAWQKLSEANALTAADAQDYALLAGTDGEWALANLIIDRFRAGNQGPEPELLLAGILDMRGDKAAAEKSLRQAVEKDKTVRSRALLARFLLTNRLNPSTTPEILALHRGLIELPNDTGAEALAAALVAGIVPPKERAKWIETLRNHPKSTPELLLAADSAEAASDPAAIPLLAAKVSSRLEKSPVEQRRAGLLWLARHNQPERALRLLARDEAIADPDSFSAWIEALASTGQVEKIPETLGLPANPFPAYRSALYRARALQLLGKKVDSAQAYQSALAASAGDSTATNLALTFLHDAGETALFEAELTKLLDTPETARPAIHALLPFVAKRRDIEAIRNFHTNALAAPGVLNKTQVQNEIDYCDLVLGRPVEITRLAELARRNPGNLAFRTTHALALFRAGKNTQALSELVIEGEPPEDRPLLARHAAIQALVLTASANPIEAAKTLAALDPALLTLQEVNLVRSTHATPGAINALVERTKATPAENRHLTAALLAREKNFDAALALVPLDEAISSPEILLPWLDACAATGRWNETLAALARPDNPLPAHTTALLTGIARKNLGQPAEARAAFDSALAASADDPDAFTTTLASLFQARETELFKENLAALDARPEFARAAIKNLLPAIQSQRDSALTLRFYKLTAAVLPDLFQKPATQNDLAYLRLILGQSTPLEPLKQRAAAEPSNLSFLATLALAQLQQGDHSSALAAFSEFRPASDFQNLPPRIRAIFAATLAANGQKDPAARISASIPAESLSFQEEEWLKARMH